jgi:hypothetical protein
MGEIIQKNDSISTREILIQKMILQQKKYQDEFMIDYQKYFNARIALLLKIPRDQIYKQYLAPLNKAINYPFFYDFFEKFYKNFIDLPSFILYKEAYLTAIANKSPLSKIESILSSNAFLQKKEFRLLFFLGHLKDLYLKKKIGTEVFMFYIQEMIHKNIFAPIAQSYWDKWIKMTKDQLIPSDLWKDIAKKFPTFELKKTKKYFIFTNTACMVCLKEIQILNTYQQKDSTIQFLIVHLGKISEEQKKILYKNIKISIFYTEVGMSGKSKDWIKKYKIEEVPSYMLIDEQQKILAFPAYGPSPDYHGRSIYDLLPQFKDSLN